MSKPVTIKDLAERLNVSVSTISRALKDNPEISEKTRLAVQQLAKELEYRPNPIAVALKTHKSYTIGIIVPQIVSSFFATVVKTVEDIAESHGYNLLVVSSNESFAKEKRGIDLLMSNRADGIMLSLTHDTFTYDHLNYIQEQGIPLVLFNRTADEIPVSQVKTNGSDAAYKAITYLIHQGAEDIVLLTGPSHLAVGGARTRGYYKAMSVNHLDVKPGFIVHCDDMTDEAAKKATLAILDSGMKVDAIFGINDNMAIGAMEALKERGVDVPGQISVVGMGNSKRSHYMTPTLTTINQHPETIGKVAAEMLFDLILDPKHARLRKESVECDLIIRESTK